MAKHSKGKPKNRKAKYNAKIKKLTAINAKSLSKAQKRHIREFGELHPLSSSDSVESNKRKLKRVSDTEAKISDSQDAEASKKEFEADEESEAEENSYQQLLDCLGNQASQPFLDLMQREEEVSEGDGDVTEAVEGDVAEAVDDSEDSGSNMQMDVQNVDNGLDSIQMGMSDKVKNGDSNDDSNMDMSRKSNGDIVVVVVDDNDVDDDDVDDDDDDDDVDDAIGKEDYRLEDAAADDSDNDDITNNKGTMDQQDPFSAHFEQDLDENVQAQLNDKNAFQERSLSVISLGKIVLSKPTLKVPLSYVEVRDLPLLNQLKVKARLCETWNTINAGENKEPFTPLQKALFNHINAYQDVFYSNRTFDNGEEIRRLYCLHAVNHVLKTRFRVLKNNAKIVQAQKEKRETEDLRDQGLTRPKVVILVPFRDSALRIVDIIINLVLSKGEGQVMNKKRFYDEYSEPGDEVAPKRAFQPDDFKKMFTGNIDDCFRVGLTVMRKAVKLYSEFYSSDIIIASPLGLRTIIGSEGEKVRDYDFLSSIEVLILDQADVFQMQNWEHVQHIFEHLHLQPKVAHDVDFSRVRNWCLNGWSKYYRQTVLFSSFTSPELNSLFNKNCRNFAGKMIACKNDLPGSICQVVTQVPQVFHRIACDSFADSADKRFDYFVSKILPEFKGPLMGHTAIFVPSYFDFVRLRNYFRREEIAFAQISEYTKRSDVTRSRTWFFEGSRPFLLYTERFYFYYRYRIRGIRNIIFYELPHHAHFYPEILNYQDGASNISSQSAPISSPVTCTVLYTKYGNHRLAGIVGRQRCGHMISSKKQVHMFITGEKGTRHLESI